MGTGNTAACAPDSSAITVQPRGYGEHAPYVDDSDIVGGSAPWVRGTPKKNVIEAAKLRFSPVGTGNTSLIAALRLVIPVQPRGYGEHSKRIHLFYITM